MNNIEKFLIHPHIIYDLQLVTYMYDPVAWTISGVSEVGGSLKIKINPKLLLLPKFLWFPMRIVKDELFNYTKKYE